MSSNSTSTLYMPNLQPTIKFNMFKEEKTQEIHQITSNTYPMSLIPCGNNQWTVLDTFTPSKHDVRDRCLVVVTVSGVLGNEGTLERWLL